LPHWNSFITANDSAQVLFEYWELLVLLQCPKDISCAVSFEFHCVHQPVSSPEGIITADEGSSDITVGGSVVDKGGAVCASSPVAGFGGLVILTG
jgi:hypothetical protein